ncbi:hypothetical protein KEM56_003104 [Ascosphaera pollenicola]|nr:hypothetical protein KEM56_003104 [Ascosphaera pollenicola]
MLLVLDEVDVQRPVAFKGVTEEEYPEVMKVLKRWNSDNNQLSSSAKESEYLPSTQTLIARMKGVPHESIVSGLFLLLNDKVRALNLDDTIVVGVPVKMGKNPPKWASREPDVPWKVVGELVYEGVMEVGDTETQPQLARDAHEYFEEATKDTGRRVKTVITVKILAHCALEYRLYESGDRWLRGRPLSPKQTVKIWPPKNQSVPARVEGGPLVFKIMKGILATFTEDELMVVAKRMWKETRSKLPYPEAELD